MLLFVCLLERQRDSLCLWDFTQNKPAWVKRRHTVLVCADRMFNLKEKWFSPWCDCTRQLCSRAASVLFVRLHFSTFPDGSTQSFQLGAVLQRHSLFSNGSFSLLTWLSFIFNFILTHLWKTTTIVKALLLNVSSCLTEQTLDRMER